MFIQYKIMKDCSGRSHVELFGTFFGPILESDFRSGTEIPGHGPLRIGPHSERPRGVKWPDFERPGGGGGDGGGGGLAAAAADLAAAPSPCLRFSTMPPAVFFRQKMTCFGKK